MDDYPIKLGSMLFTLVEPHPGFALAYNRWYERDHFYAGCMIGAYTFAGQRFVATRADKALRFPTTPTPITPQPSVGSYLALYWILAGCHDEWNRWAVDQVRSLHASHRMFPQRDHVHTLLYNYDWGLLADPDGPSPELALDHRYAGLVAVFGELEPEASRATLDAWYREVHLPSVLGRTPIGQCLAFSARPLLADAPVDVPRSPVGDRHFLHLYFLEAEGAAVWDHFRSHAADLDRTGLAHLVWASPFRPTIPGTDTYADEL